MLFSSAEMLAGQNHIHFSPSYLNWITLPIIPTDGVESTVPQ